METYEARLASFTRKKGSFSRWPYPSDGGFSVTPRSLAAAGFYYDAVKGDSHSDNVTCVHCYKSLEGWEEGDLALTEHLKRAIDDEGNKCPWATIVDERDNTTKGKAAWMDPHGEVMLAARLGTFGSWWEYDGRKGWKPTSQRGRSIARTSPRTY